MENHKQSEHENDNSDDDYVPDDEPETIPGEVSENLEKDKNANGDAKQVRCNYGLCDFHNVMFAVKDFQIHLKSWHGIE